MAIHLPGCRAGLIGWAAVLSLSNPEGALFSGDIAVISPGKGQGALHLPVAGAARGGIA
ncbi:MAG: hypothetical protein WBO29_03865 [Albidovulum sp.]